MRTNRKQLTQKGPAQPIRKHNSQIYINLIIPNQASLFMPQPEKPQATKYSNWLYVGLLLFAGWLVHYALAPYNYWPLGLVACATLAWSLINTSAKQGLIRSFLFGIGMYGGGVSWVYISIHDFGFTGAPLAVVMTAVFVVFLAFVFALPFYVYSRFIQPARFGFILGFAAVWVIGEWIRGWLLTGFPWLYLGYGHIHTALSGWAPITGVLGISFLCALSSSITLWLLQEIYRKIQSNKTAIHIEATSAYEFHYKHVIMYAFLLCLIWSGGFGLTHVQWTQARSEVINVAMVQPNIPLQMKWDPFYAPEILDIIDELTEPLWQNDLIIWPENAVPYFYNQGKPVVNHFREKATNSNTSLITGILYDESYDEFYNSIIGLGTADGIYHKQRLVPFGEYVPLEQYLRGIISFFNLPTSIIQIGPDNPEGLGAQTKAGEAYRIAPLICYEVVYPDLAGKLADKSQLLITISNDAWFGRSIGPLQHYQMAQMRALENQKFMIRATNTGVSGIINPQGETVIRGGQFSREVIKGQVTLYDGHTPFTKLGAWPLLLALFAYIGYCLLYRFRKSPDDE